MQKIQALVACQNESCAAEMTHHLNNVRMLDGLPICEVCYGIDHSESDTDWTELQPVRMSDLGE